MVFIFKPFVFTAILSVVYAFQSLYHGNFMNKVVSKTLLREFPLELTGQLDPKRFWDVKLIFRGEEKTVSISEGTSILHKAEKLFKGVESSCRNGVCTTCAGKIEEGKPSTLLGVHGLGEPQVNAGFICTCQCYVTGPGVVIRLDQFDEVYESQYGQFEKSYGELKYSTK